MATDAGPAAGAALSVGYRGPACPRCALPLDLAQLLSGRQWCPSCAQAFEAVRFEAPPRESRILGAAAIGTGAAFACPAHKGNAAVASCERCGVFLCALCRIDLDGQPLCPACFERVAASGELAVVQSRLRDFEALGYLLALGGVLCGCVGVVTGPAAMFCALKARRQRLAWGDGAHNGRMLMGVAVGLMSLVLSVVVLGLLLSEP